MAVPPPRIDAVLPDSVVMESPQRIRLTGSRFKDVTAAVVEGESVGTLEQLTPTSCVWVVTFSTPAVVGVRLRTADGKESNPVMITVRDQTLPDPSPPTNGYGPRAIAKPSGAVTITPGQGLQAMTDQHPAGTTFWLTAGEHRVSGSCFPKSGNQYYGEFGAVIDGTGWSSTDLDDAAFRGVGREIHDVGVYNLEIRHMPSYGVDSYLNQGLRWIVDHCDIHTCRTGISLGSQGTVSHCRIHHCSGSTANDPNPAARGGGYAFNQSDDLLFVHNEVSANGWEQKFLMILNLTCRDNWWHHNEGDGFWIDGEGNGSIVEDNVSEFNGRTGYTVEMGVEVTLRRNVSRYNAASGILLSMSRNCDVGPDNSLDGDQFVFDLFVNCESLTEGYPWHPDLRDNYIHHNDVWLNGGQCATILSWLHGQTCYPPYVSPEKNNRLDYNRYHMSDGQYWVWGDQQYTFAGWQGLGHDTHGVLAARLTARRQPQALGLAKAFPDHDTWYDSRRQ